MKAPPTAPAAVIAALLAACAPQPSPNAAVPATPPGPIDTVAIRGYTRFLSDDALRGRATGTPEADIAAVYIQSACIGLGLQPVSGGYSQSVNLHRITINPSGTGLILSGPAGRRAFQYRSGFMPNFGLETKSGFSGPAVYVGHSDDIAEGRLGNLNLRGAVAVVAGPVLDVLSTLRDRSLLRSYEPPEAPGTRRFGYYESIREFAAEKLRHGAKSDIADLHTHYFLTAGRQRTRGFRECFANRA